MQNVALCDRVEYLDFVLSGDGIENSLNIRPRDFNVSSMESFSSSRSNNTLLLLRLGKQSFYSSIFYLGFLKANCNIFGLGSYVSS